MRLFPLLALACLATTPVAADALSAGQAARSDRPAEIRLLLPEPASSASDPTPGWVSLPAVQYQPVPWNIPIVPDTPDATTAQQLVVRIAPGPLTITPTTVSLELRRAASGGWYGDLPALTIIDARGALAGWTARVSLPHDDRTRDGLDVTLVPAAPTVVWGSPFGVAPGRDAELTTHHPVVVCRAAPRSGGGTYRCGGRLVLDGIRRHAGGAVRLTVVASVS